LYDFKEDGFNSDTKKRKKEVREKPLPITCPADYHIHPEVLIFAAEYKQNEETLFYINNFILPPPGGGSKPPITI
jgi:hypothetical protein